MARKKTSICFDDVDFENPANPLRHFPTMPGRGRPPKTKRWDMVALKSNGEVVDGKFRGTQRQAYKKADSLIKQGYVQVLVDGPFRTQRAATKAMKRVKRAAKRPASRTVARRAQASVGIISELFGFNKPVKAATAAKNKKSDWPYKRSRKPGRPRARVEKSYTMADYRRYKSYMSRGHGPEGEDPDLHQPPEGWKPPKARRR